MVNILRNLRINRVASVDKGAGEGVSVVLMKRDETAEEANGDIEIGKGITFERKADGTTRFWHADAESPDDNTGSNDKKKPAKAKSKAKVSKVTSSALTRGLELLQKSVESLFEVTPAERSELLTQTFNEFETHVQSEMTASGEDDPASAAAQEGTDISGVNKGQTDMTEAEVTALKKKLEDAEYEVLFLKMSPEKQAFAKALPEEARKAFPKKDPKEQDKDMEDCAKKAQENIPESVQKALEEAAVTKAANEALAKRVAELEASKETETLAKRAVEIGQTPAFAETLQKARKGDLTAVTKLEDTIKALTAQVKEAGLFKEIGTDVAKSGSALDQLNAKADELRKADPKLSTVKAFEKVYTAPENQTLVKAYKQETGKSAAA